MSIFFRYPFVYIGEFGIKPSLLCLMCFIVLSIVFAARGKAKNRFAYRLELAELWKTPGDRAQLIIMAVIYLACALACWFQPVVGEEGTVVTTVAEHLLHYEAPLALLLLLCMVMAALICGNRHRYLRMVNQAVAVLLLLCVFCTQVNRQVPQNIWNSLCYAALGVVFLWLHFCQIQQVPVEREEDCFAAVREYEKLFPWRQETAKQLAQTIKDVGGKPFSICVSGRWGSGKTSIVNGALAHLNGELGGEYEVIYINALELDTLQSLLNYVFSRIRDCLRDRGAYVGIGSEYRSFLSAAMGSLTPSSVVPLIEDRLFPQVGDYREEKRQLEELLSKSMKEKGGIVIVVDDIERCDEEKAKQFVYFIREIATMNHCVAIFITDYQYLSKFSNTKVQSGSARENAEYRYYEKFFNYRLDLSGVEPGAAMLELERRLELELPLELTQEFGKPSKVFVQYRERFEQSEEKRLLQPVRRKSTTSAAASAPQADPALQKQACRKHFLEEISNLRNLTKFYHVTAGYYAKLREAFPGDLVGQEEQQGKVREYFKKIRLDKLLFLLAYMEVCLPFEAKELKTRGEEYLDVYNRANALNEDRQIIMELGMDVLFEADAFGSGAQYSYRQRETLEFVHTFFNQPQDLPKIMNPYTEEEQEWFACVDAGELEAIKQKWLQTVNAVLRTYYQESVDDGREKLRKLFHFGAEKIKRREWSADMVLAFLAHERELYLAGDLDIMKMLWTELKDIQMVVSGDAAGQINQFSERYVYYRMMPAYKMLAYCVGMEENGLHEGILKSAYENLLGAQRTVEARLAEFVVRVGMPEQRAVKDVFGCLDTMAEEIENVLGAGMLKFSDVQGDLERMRRSTQDLNYFVKLCKKIDGDGGTAMAVRRIECRDPEHMQPVIEEFQAAFSEENALDDGGLRESFVDLFNRIKRDPAVQLDESQLEALHELVSVYLKQTKDRSIFYRKTLMDYERKSRPKQRGLR